MNINLLELSAASVSRSVALADGTRPGHGGVTAFAVVPALNLGRPLAIGGATIKSDGSFSMRIPPGEYEFEAHTGGMAAAPGWACWAEARATVAPHANIQTVDVTSR